MTKRNKTTSKQWDDMFSNFSSKTNKKIKKEKLEDDSDSGGLTVDEKTELLEQLFSVARTIEDAEIVYVLDEDADTKDDKSQAEVTFTPDTNTLKETLQISQLETGASKHLEDKLRMDLVPSEMVYALGEVLTYGSLKYEDHNWRKGIPFSVSYAATQRHLAAFWAGVDYDEESGIHHLKHAMCNLGMLITAIEHSRIDLDDRYGIEYEEEDEE